ncbi:MAG: L-threonylcarbamoyladenylate synthase [Victivallales bacterium]
MLSKALETLRKPGAVLLVPTETVYGLVCDWSDPIARDRIYAMKHRAENKPLAAFVPSPAHAETLCGCPLPAAAKRLAERFMPGPVTLVVPDKNGVTFGFRIPDHPFILELLNACGKPLASTSANRSGEPPALEVSYACSSLAEQPDCVVDAGPLPSNSLASTVILVNANGSWKLLREGPVSKAEIEQALC